MIVDTTTTLQGSCRYEIRNEKNFMKFSPPRNPDPHHRPSFEAVFRVLRRPEELLLHWSEEDRAAGRHLLRGPQQNTHSFSDLQNKYSTQ